MRAQITLTPTESKKLIAKAIANMDVVKGALAEGTVAMHPSTSTYFLFEEITGQKPQTEVWLCGVVAPKGACIERSNERAIEPKIVRKTPEDFPHTWVIRGGKLTVGETLGQLFDAMGPKDVYVKGVNALDASGTVGVLIGNRVEGGTIGRVMGASRRRGFSVVFPAGLEKLIPIPVEVAAREALKTDYAYSMGINCGLLPCKGITITETKAIEILSGAATFPISAGGVGGAEGSVTLVIKGSDQQVLKAIEYAEQCKGAKLPQVQTPECATCQARLCDFPLTGKHWI